MNKILDFILPLLLERFKLNPLTWINGYKALIGKIIMALSAAIAVLQFVLDASASGATLSAFVTGLVALIVGKLHDFSKERRGQ